MSSLPPNIAAVLFDFDGTLVRQEIDFALMRERVLAVARAYGAPEELLSGRYVLELIDLVTPALGARGIAFARQAYAEITAIEAAAAEQAVPFAGASEMLLDLRARGYRLGIITRNCRAAVQRVLRTWPLVYDTLLTRDDVPDVKPAPQHLLAALHELQVYPCQALMVGDHPMDILGGRRAGTATAGILPSGAREDYYAEYPPDLVLRDIAGLAACLAPQAARAETSRVELLSSQTIYDGVFKLQQATLRYRRFHGEWITPHRRLLFERGDAAAVLPFDPLTRRVVLVGQFRYPDFVRGGSGWLWEAVAGTVDDGRDSQTVARTEALEEAGYALGDMELVTTTYLSPGAGTERVSIYIAPVTPGMRRSSGGGLPEEQEDILVRLIPLEEALCMARDGRIRDAKTILALQYLELNAQRLFEGKC